MELVSGSENAQRIALGLEYCGTPFRGWQRQTDGETVQGALESAIAAIAEQPIAVTAAGRTDSGVHATGQVVHADLPVSRPITAWVRGVNSHLPAEIAVNWAVPVADDFHARFSATGRAYRYVILNRATRPGVDIARVGWYHRRLDEAAMAAAAMNLTGTHDFSSFRAAECQARSPIRDLRVLTVARQGDFVIVDAQADAFLHHMVRNLVGTLVAVGNGSRSPDWTAELLAQRDRRRAAPTFSPNGLYLSEVFYDPVWNLPKPAKCLIQTL